MIDTESFDFIQLVRISTPDPTQLGERQIGINKFTTRMMSKARANAKRETCFLCNKECSSFCNSHSIPEFTLRSIAEKGKVIATLQKELSLLGQDTGLNKAGTFQIICRECDSSVFRDYETPEAYDQIPTGKMLAEIALKDYLRMVNRRLVEDEFYKLLGQRFPNHKNMTDEKQFIGSNDLQDFLRGFHYAHRTIQKNEGNRYHLCFHAILDYVVPYAAQSPIVLISDLEDNVVNDVYNFSPTYQTESIHIAVFPLEGKSIVLMFVEEGRKRYRKFIKQFNRLSQEDQLATINFMVFAYTENVYLSAKIADKLHTNEAFMDVCRITADYTAEILLGDPLTTAVKGFSLSKRNDIPNLLNKEYALR